MASSRTGLRHCYPFKPPTTSIDHLVVGGGAIGLSVAAGLVNTCGKDRTTFVIERREKFAKVGGDQFWHLLIVATSNSQVPYIDRLQTHSLHKSFLTESRAASYESNSVIPAYFLSGSEALEMEPDLSRDTVAALLLTETGVVDYQALVDTLTREIEESDYLFKREDVAVGVRKGRREQRGHGVVMLGTRVVRVDRDTKGKGWVVQLENGWEGKGEGERGELESVRAEVVVNAAGLGATSLLEGVVPDSDRVQMRPSKGTYFSYKGPGINNISRLIHPSPGDAVDHLSARLSLDVDGNVRFGPDIQQLGASDSDLDALESESTPSSDRIASIGSTIQDYLPDIDPNLLTPESTEIQPNISSPKSGFSDFMFRHSSDRQGLVELLGFNSPGLTSSLAIGEYVAAMVRRDVWKAEGNVEALADGWE